MAYRVIAVNIKKLGFCCQYSYFLAVASTSTRDVAAELRVHKRTVRRWWQACRERKIICALSAYCFFNERQNTPLPLTDESLAVLPELDPSPLSEP